MNRMIIVAKQKSAKIQTANVEPGRRSDSSGLFVTRTFLFLFHLVVIEFAHAQFPNYDCLYRVLKGSKEFLLETFPH
jgi:hypothetical protein